MQEALYLTDSYLQSCKAKVVAVNESKFVFLDQTIFYPRGPLFACAKRGPFEPSSKWGAGSPATPGK